MWIRTLLLATLVVVFAWPPPARAQAATTGDIWHELAARLQPGTRIVLQVTDGTRVKATFVKASDEDITIVPRTRVPVPPQQVPYAAIAALDVEDARTTQVGRAVGIGVASGVGAFLGMLLIMVASISD